MKPTDTNDLAVYLRDKIREGVTLARGYEQQGDETRASIVRQMVAVQKAELEALPAASVTVKVCTTDKAAVAAGYAGFNVNPHVCIDTQDHADTDGNVTISLRLPDGQQVTFAVMPKAHCIDVQLHSKNRHPERADLPTFHMVGFGPGKDVFDSRTVERDTGKKLTLATVLLDKP